MDKAAITDRFVCEPNQTKLFGPIANKQSNETEQTGYIQLHIKHIKPQIHGLGLIYRVGTPKDGRSISTFDPPLDDW